MSGLLPNYIMRQWTSDGKMASGGLVYFYQSGTLVPKTVYKDAGLTIAHTNPVQLSASGTEVIFLADGAYRVWVKDQYGQQIEPWLDGVVGSGGSGGEGSNSTFVTVKLYADLRALSTTPDTVYVTGKIAEGDGGAGWFQKIPGSTAIDDDGVILTSSAGSNVYKRVFDGVIDPQWYGVRYGVSTDQTVFLQHALTGSVTHNYPVQVTGSVYINQNITVPTKAALIATDDGFFTASLAVNMTFADDSKLTCTSRTFGSNVFPKIGKRVIDRLKLSYMGGSVADDRMDKLFLASTLQDQIIEIDESVSILASTWICPNTLEFTNNAYLTFTGASSLVWTSKYIKTEANKMFQIDSTASVAFDFGSQFAYAEMLGAVADGVTDDTIAFTYASTNKRIVLVEGKTYLVNGNISISEANIKGAGTILLGTTSTLTINTFSIDSVTIALKTRNNTGASATIQHSDTSGNATLVAPGFPFGVKAGTHISVPGFTGGNWVTTADSDNLTIVTGLGWGTADYFAGGIATVTSAPDSTGVYLVADTFYAKDSAFPSYYTANTELFEGCTFTDLARTMVHNPPNLYKASLPLIRSASALGTDPTGLIVGVGMSGTDVYVQGVDYTLTMGNNTWGTTVTGSSFQIIDITPHLSILTWTMDMHGGIPPQSPTNLFAYVNFTAISDKLKARLGLSTLKYGSNKLVNGIVNRLGATVYQSGRTIPYPVTFPHVMNMAFQSGYVLDFVFLGPKGTEGSDSQNGYTPNPWMGWGDIYSAGTGYIATPDYQIGGSGLLVNQNPFG